MLCGVSDYDFVRLRPTEAQLQGMLEYQRAEGLVAQRLERHVRYVTEGRRPACAIAEYREVAEQGRGLF